MRAHYRVAALAARFARQRGARDRPHDAIVHAAAAEMAVERRGDLAAGRARIVREQRGRGNQYARKAIAALAGLLVEERLLQRRERASGREPLDGRHGLSGEAFDWT